jgi:hypothetical protein
LVRNFKRKFEGSRTIPNKKEKTIISCKTECKRESVSQRALKLKLDLSGGESSRLDTKYKSLILAQDERWRRA